MKLAVISAAWVAGLLIGLDADVAGSSLALFLVASAVLGCILWIRGRAVFPAVLLLVLLTGLLRVETSETHDLLTTSRYPGTVALTGLVANDPELSGSLVEFVLSVEGGETAGETEEPEARVLVFARPTDELVRSRDEPYFHYGDRLNLIGRLERPQALGDFDYGAYLASQRIHTVLSRPEVTLIGEEEGSSARAAVYGLRHRLSRGIETALPEPPASLAQALFLGERGRLPQDVTEEFRSSGTSHLLAISGLHIGVVLALVLGISSWLFGKKRQVYLLLPLGSIWLYAVLSGLSPSVERAAIMGSVYLLALAIGRPRSALPGLALAAGVMAGFDPKILKQVSFQLSFTAVTGLALLNISDLRLWDRFLPATAGGLRSLLARAVITAATVSVVATLATVPLVAFHLHRVPTLGILATMLALPALPFLLVTSAAAGAVGSIHTQAGEMVGWVAWVPLQYVLEVVHLVSRVPGSTFNVGAFSGLLVWVYYSILLALVLNPKGVRGAWAALRILTPGGDQAKVEGAQAAVRRHLLLGASVVGAIALGVVGTLLWLYATSGPDGKLHVHFLDVGQGDSTLIVTPEGRQVLIDGGPGTTDATHALGERLPFWDRDLDMVVLTHPDEDHFLGLVEVLDRYDVGIVMEGGGASDNPLYIEWEKELEQGKSRRFAAAQGQTVLLDGATWMQVLNPPDDGPR